MKRTIFVLVLTLISLSQSVQACQRCGLFGRNCRYYSQPVYSTPVKQYTAPVQQYTTPVVQQAIPVYKQPEVYVVQNNYPPANAYGSLIAPQGNTVIGYQEYSQAYSINPPEFIRSAQKLAEASLATAQLGITAHTQAGLTQLSLQANLAEPLIKSKAAVDVLQAAGLNQSSVGQVETHVLKFRIENGKVIVEQPDPASLPPEIVPPAPPQPTQSQANSLIAQKCAKCHGLNVTPPKGDVNIDVGYKLLASVSRKARLAVINGTMPPEGESALSEQEKCEIIKELTLLESEN